MRPDVFVSPEGLVAVRMADTVKAGVFYVVNPAGGGWFANGAAQTAKIEAWTPLVEAVSDTSLA